MVFNIIAGRRRSYHAPVLAATAQDAQYDQALGSRTVRPVPGSLTLVLPADSRKAHLRRCMAALLVNQRGNASL